MDGGLHSMDGIIFWFFKMGIFIYFLGSFSLFLDGLLICRA